MSTKSDCSSIKNGSIASKSSAAPAESVTEEKKSKGLTIYVAAFFMVAQMAGAGFLSLPRAMADTGWIGIPLMLLFCGTVGYAATRIGYSWVIVEQRYPEEYKNGTRQPYQEIAYKSLGIIGRRVCMASVVINLFGSGTVFLILISQMMTEMTPLSVCTWICITAAFLIPFSWLGSPKDFKFAPILAVIVTIIAVIVIFSKLLIDKDLYEPPVYPNPTIGHFFLGFGPIVFSFGGASVFPTIQNDMAHREHFWKSVIIAFSIVLVLYFPVTITGYTIIGDQVESNILTTLPIDDWVKAAMGFQIINLLGTSLITFNPVALAFEDIFNVPPNFGIKRVLLRTSIFCLEILVALAVPDFGKILNLIGGSVITIVSFILPPLMYMKLCDAKGDWPTWELPLWERIYLIEIMIVGTIGGISSTITAFIEILNPDSFGDSCFVSFTRTD